MDHEMPDDDRARIRAIAEAADDAEAIDATDRAFGRLFAEARAAGELPESADARRLARAASATIHTLSIRARPHPPRRAPADR